jgi:hypothetical protein
VENLSYEFSRPSAGWKICATTVQRLSPIVHSAVCRLSSAVYPPREHAVVYLYFRKFENESDHPPRRYPLAGGKPGVCCRRPVCPPSVVLLRYPVIWQAGKPALRRSAVCGLRSNSFIRSPFVDGSPYRTPRGLFLPDRMPPTRYALRENAGCRHCLCYNNPSRILP